MMAQRPLSDLEVDLGRGTGEGPFLADSCHCSGMTGSGPRLPFPTEDANVWN
jgi:hypothetical protein